MRNSVKVTVDAYDGTITYYADLTDPIAQVWDVYPALFTPIDQASDEFRSHFRYPENLFQVQATQYATYHVTDPGSSTRTRTDGRSRRTRHGAPHDRGNDDDDLVRASDEAPPLLPVMRAPGEDVEAFQLVLPFVREGRQNIVAWLAASSDPDDLRPAAVAGAAHRGERAGPLDRVLPAQPGPAVLPGAHPARSGRLQRALRRPSRDPDRELVLVRAAGLRSGEPVHGGPRAEARGGRQRRHGGRGRELGRGLAAAVEGVEPDGGGPGGDGGGDGGIDATVADLLAEAADPSPRPIRPCEPATSRPTSARSRRRRRWWPRRSRAVRRDSDARGERRHPSPSASPSP